MLLFIYVFIYLKVLCVNEERIALEFYISR